MTLFILEQLKPGVRGELRKWMLEIRPGVFIGTISARVRENLWKKLVIRVKEDQMTELHYLGAWMIHSAPNEQGYVMQTVGETKKEIVDFDGLTLIATRR